jgi:hypothetical protein
MLPDGNMVLQTGNIGPPAMPGAVAGDDPQVMLQE